MQKLLDALTENSTGILLLLLIVIVLLYVLGRLAKIFNWGRYKQLMKSDSDSTTETSDLSHGLSTFFVNLINDFKHLLALVIVLIFTGLIIYSMAASDQFEEKLEALQLVIASLGGLLGSIIGYYFGESAGRGSNPSISLGSPSPPPPPGSDPQPGAGGEEIEPAPNFNPDERE